MKVVMIMLIIIILMGKWRQPLAHIDKITNLQTSSVFFI